MRGTKDKILVLVMSCNLPEYKQKEEDIRNTWAKGILEKKYHNIDLWFFTSGEHDMIDVSKHKIFTKCSDLRDRTFQKVMKTINIVDANGFEYDWILRVNTTTYINIELIDKIIQHAPNPEYAYSGTLFCQPWILDKLPFLSGEYVILSKKNVGLLKAFYQVNKEYFDKLEQDARTKTQWICDDGWMTTCFVKTYKAQKDSWEYTKRIHSTGLLFCNYGTIPDDIRERIPVIPGICFKTVHEIPGREKFLRPEEQYKLDHEQIYKIHEIVEAGKVPQEIIDEWYKWYILNVYDKWCYSNEHIIESQKVKRDFSKRITKRAMVKWYNDQKKLNKK